MFLMVDPALRSLGPPRHSGWLPSTRRSDRRASRRLATPPEAWRLLLPASVVKPFSKAAMFSCSVTKYLSLFWRCFWTCDLSGVMIASRISRARYMIWTLTSLICERPVPARTSRRACHSSWRGSKPHDPDVPAIAATVRNPRTSFFIVLQIVEPMHRPLLLVCQQKGTIKTAP